MSREPLNSLVDRLAQAPLDWELRLALIQAYVIRDKTDEAKRLVRDSPDEAGPAPPQVQYRLHRLMTEGRSAAEEFAQEDGQELGGEVGEVSDQSSKLIEVEVISAVADESKDPSNKLIEVEVIPARGDRPAENVGGVEGEIASSAEGMFGVMADQEELPAETKTDVVQSDSVIPGDSVTEFSVEENPIKRVDPSLQQRELDNSRFIIELIEEFRPSKPVPEASRKASALAVAVLIHLILIVILGVIVIADSCPNPPQIVALNAEEDQVLEVPPKRFETVKRPKLSAASAQTTMVITSAALSPITMAEFDVSDVSFLPTSMIGFGNGMGTSGEGTGAGDRVGMIGGLKIKSRRLGVILDVSGSMDAQIRAVRLEIRKNFSTATVVEVVGCSLDWREDDPSFDLAKARGKVRLKRNADSVVDAVTMLIVAANVDAIFWFSDLMDSQSKSGEQRLSHLLGTQFGSSRRPVKFYVQSVDKEPSPALSGIAKRSGGATKVKSFE